MIAGAQAVVFDMDGVLWSSSRAHAAAYQRAFAEAGIDGPSYESLAGRRTPEAVADVLRAHGRSAGCDGVAAIVDRKRSLVRAVLREDPPVAVDAVDVINAITSGGTRVGLASSASRGSVEIFLAATGLESRFDVVLSGDDVDNAKPSPDIYLAAFAALNVPAAGAVVVEDSVSGIAAARAAGATVVGIVGTHTERDLADRVDVVIHSLSELVVR